MTKTKNLRRAALVVALTAGVTAGTAVALASPASAAPACYRQSPMRMSTDAERVESGYGTYWRSAASWYVDQDSTCRDVNLSRSWNDQAGHGQCVDYRIRFGMMPQAATAWKTVCRRWTVVFPNVPRGMAFSLESRDVPASAVVRA